MSIASSILLISAGIGSMGLVAKGIRVTGESGTLNWNGDEHGKSGGVCLASSKSMSLLPSCNFSCLISSIVVSGNLGSGQYNAAPPSSCQIASDGISGGSLCCLECRARMNLRCSSSGSVGRSSGSTLDSVDILFCRVASISVLLEAQIQGAERARDRGHPIAELSEECEKIEGRQMYNPCSDRDILRSRSQRSLHRRHHIRLEDESICVKVQFVLFPEGKNYHVTNHATGKRLWHNLNQGHSSNICLIGPCPQRLSRKINM
ncbi:hypothetical protein KCU87_g340, partial [Aureobasidium melanogenum]